jgi:hypothetical protein
MDDIERKLAKKLEDLFMEAVLGPPRKQRQTTLRARGGGFETVELDDDGNIIEPVRCICGSYAIMHRPNCPFAYVCT